MKDGGDIRLAQVFLIFQDQEKLIPLLQVPEVVGDRLVRRSGSQGFPVSLQRLSPFSFSKLTSGDVDRAAEQVGR